MLRLSLLIAMFFLCDSFVVTNPNSERNTRKASFVVGSSRSPVNGENDDESLVMNAIFASGPSEEDEDVIRMLRGNIGNQEARTRVKSIFVMSDTTGVTAKAVVEKSLAQFNGCDDRFTTFTTSEDEEDCELLQTRVFSFCKTEQLVADVVRKAARRDAMLVFTLANPDLREKAGRMCELEDLIYVDLLGPMFRKMGDFFQREPLGRPTDYEHPRRNRRALSDSYYRRIEAVEFTLKADDGMAPWLLPEADVVIVGVSRTGKTPLSVVLSQSQGLKVANVPLVQEVVPPRQLFTEVDPRRVFSLTLNPADLQRIRKSRLARELDKVEGSAKSNYADRKYLVQDLMNAKRLTDENHWTEVDVSGRAVEETASLIISLLNQRFPDVSNDDL
jgi:regulator of PEP synthase PpsR (kinase-PPPase family)